jgi:hypothetical protein
MTAADRKRKHGPLESCCNGCPKPPKPPSWVLCEDCFAKLDAQMQALGKSGKRPASPGAE